MESRSRFPTYLSFDLFPVYSPPFLWIGCPLCSFSSLYNVPDSRCGVPSLFWLSSFWQHLPQSHIKSCMRPFPTMVWEAGKLRHRPWNRPSVFVGVGLRGQWKAKHWAIPWFWHISGQCWVYDYEVGWCFALWKNWAKKRTTLDQTTIISGHAMKDRRSSKAASRKTLTSCTYWADFAQNQTQGFQKKV